ncbi:MAG: rhombosortase [Cellvibrio sp.]|uniref:rhombosortase n=1 Tax=Cellvibrio sp. TaxID=1965322 RepID=UPI0031A9AECE
MLLLTALDIYLFPFLNLEADKVITGEYWRILTANLVHFGWPHTLMNIAAFLLCSFVFFNDLSLKKYSLLLLWCCLGVGVGVFFFSPEYSPYAGLSGAIHGLIVAGLIQTRAYPMWIKIGGLILIAGKLIQENLPGYQATDLQELIPVAIAVESHVYGAIAGALFAGGDWLLTRLKR